MCLKENFVDKTDLIMCTVNKIYYIHETSHERILVDILTNFFI